MIMPQNLPPGQKPLVLVTHDESTFQCQQQKTKTLDKRQQTTPKANKGSGERPGGLGFSHSWGKAGRG